MNLYPNFNSLNTFFCENFNDYDKFTKNLKKIEFTDDTNIYDFKYINNTKINSTYNPKKIYETPDFIIDSYFNLYVKSLNIVYIHNYINFPEYVLYLLYEEINNNINNNINEKIDLESFVNNTIIKLKDFTDKALTLLKLTKYIIINRNSNSNSNNDDDIEDTIYLKNKLEEYKFNHSELNYIIAKKDQKIVDLNKTISELKLKNRKANFTLMENQNIFSELHVEISEYKDQINKLQIQQT